MGSAYLHLESLEHQRCHNINLHTKNFNFPVIISAFECVLPLEDGCLKSFKYIFLFSCVMSPSSGSCELRDRPDELLLADLFIPFLWVRGLTLYGEMISLLV